MGKEIPFDELIKASDKLTTFWSEYCSPNDAIIIDCYGVRIVCDELFISKKRLIETDEPLS